MTVLEQLYEYRQQKGYDTRSILQRIEDRMRERVKEVYTVSQCKNYLEYRDGLTYVRVKRPENWVVE